MLKRVSALAVLVGFAAAIYAGAAPGVKVTAVATDPPTGSFAPKYEIVVWIQDAAGAFIKTLAIWGNQRNSNDLPIWYAHSAASVVNAVTSATLSAATTAVANWDLKNASGTTVPNGIYTFNIELSNHHSSTTAYTDWYLSGKINVNGTSSTKIGADSVVDSATTYITRDTAVYTAATAVRQTSPEKTVNQISNPLEFKTPTSFGAGAMTMRLIATNGKVVWQQRFATSSDRIVRLQANTLRQTNYSGVGILEADYGSQKISRLYIQNNR